MVSKRSRLLSALLLIATPCLLHAKFSLSAEEIVELSHEAAGGEVWTGPQSLYLLGSSTFFEGNAQTHFDRHEMWRIYPTSKASAHEADGKVRIRSSQDGVSRIDLAFDGQRTRVNGQISDETSDSRRWASNFGFGVIRHALDPGYTLTRLADDQVDATPSFTIRVTDPAGQDTIFGIAMASYEVLMVGFDTPRGWHERIYSEFFSKPGSRWNQSGRVRLYYDGVKQNEVRWTDFEVNTPFAPEVFQFSGEDSKPPPSAGSSSTPATRLAPSATRPPRTPADSPKEPGQSAHRNPTSVRGTQHTGRTAPTLPVPRLPPLNCSAKTRTSRRIYCSYSLSVGKFCRESG